MVGFLHSVASELECEAIEPVSDVDLRRQVKAELDVFVARDFFGLTRDEMRYILDPSSILGEDCGIETFGALKRLDVRLHGRFVTYDLIIKAWDEMPPTEGRQ